VSAGRHQRRYPRRAERRDVRARRLRRLGGLALALVLTAAVALGLMRDGSHSSPPGVAAANAAELAPDTAPQPIEIASAGSLVLSLPIAQGRVTAIVYHGTGDPTAIPLQPSGHQRNAGFLARLGDTLFGGSSSSSGPAYYIDNSAQGPDTAELDVGAPATTHVYAPVSGQVVAIQPRVLNGSSNAAYGSIVQIRPTAAPAVLVDVSNIRVPPTLRVGSQVTSSQTRLGTVVDLSHVISQTVAKYTSDAGNHVAITLSRAPGASPLL
jgi:hypothetical protein